MNEPGLYRLVGKSEMSRAEGFHDWVYEEVLPSIRKTGSYNLPSAMTKAEMSKSDQAEGHTMHAITSTEATETYSLQMFDTYDLLLQLKVFRLHDAAIR